MTIRTFTSIACLLLASPLLQAKHYKLFVLTGQSNSLGTTNGGEADPTSGTDPADQHVQFFWDNVVTGGDTIGDSGGVFTTLQDQQGGRYGGSATHWGGEIEFGRGLYRAGVRDFGIIKASRGGGGNGHWLKGSSDDHMYDHVLTTVNVATADLHANGHTFEIVGLMYLQGESDGGTEITEAGTRLKTLTDNLRADLLHPDTSAPIAASMHTIAAGTTAAGLTSSANQKLTADVTSYMDFFANDDLTSKLSPDGLHLNKEGKTIVGRRWAQAFLNAGITGISRHYGKLTFIGDSITQGGNGDHPSYRYQVFTDLANANVPNNSATGYEFAGSVTGAHSGGAGGSVTTPDVNGQTFANIHDGHYGWRSFWINAREDLPGARYNTGNLGQGTLENWTGQTTTFDTTNAGTLTYTGSTYTPDTVVMKIGINDLADGTSASQLRDDISTLIDQLRAANANVRIHLCQVLYSNNVAFASVDAINALLPTLVTTKNASSITSPVWLVDTNEGFDPTSMTFDNTHPNSVGEAQVGNIISVGLSITAPAVAVPTPATIAEKSSDTLGCFHFEGSDIYNSGSFASGWSTDGSITPTPTGVSDLQLVHPSSDGRTLNGTSTGWSTINHTEWTFETRIKLNDVTNGYALWLGTGTNRIIVEIHPGFTKSNTNKFNESHTNNDGEFHTFKVTNDPSNSVYHVWRDGVLLTAPAGVAYDATAGDERLLMGDYTGGTFGNNYDVTIDYVEYCQGFKGNEIHDGTSYINDWSTIGSVTPTLVNTDDLQIVNGSTGGSWLEGDITGWSANNDGDWTFEIRAQFNSVANGFVIWLGTSVGTAQIAIYDDHTENLGANPFSVAHTNNDGQFHTYRVTHDSDVQVYHVFRDGVRLTDIDGVPFDAAGGSDLILGDYTGGTFGNGFDVTIDCINIDYTGVWIPVNTDTDADGISDLWENIYFTDPTLAIATEDSDNDSISNLNEFLADTDPTDRNSFFTVQSITETGSENFSLSVPDSSSQRNYTLYQSADLVSPWTEVTGHIDLAGNDGELTFDVSSTLAKNFYYIEVSFP